MAQGALKKNPSATANSHHKAKRNAPVLGLKKGARVIAPKKADLVKHKKINKKFTSGLTAQTERKLAERAGHLEILKGGKKKGSEIAKEKEAAAAKARKSG